MTASQDRRPRLRDLGVGIGRLPTGGHNALTDVGGVRVGHRTFLQGDAVRTGATAILPHGGNVYQQKVPAAVYAGNAFGKLLGSLQVAELGNIETPIVLTNTLAVPAAAAALIRYTLQQPGNERVMSVNPVVGETNDGRLNDIRGLHVTEGHVREALASAASGPVEEGAVGAGTGTVAFGFKGGIGTSSRKLPDGATVGVLAQTNYGGSLRIAGVPLGEPASDPGDGSCMIVVGTDAPVDARNLRRLAKRAVLGLGRTGSFMSGGSGDFVIAFSTAYRIPHEAPDRLELPAMLSNRAVSGLFEACVEATEEALLNSMLRARTVIGRGGLRAEALPVDRVLGALRRHGMIP